jgi:hypothetical protein
MIRLAFDGAVNLVDAFLIATNTTLDASGHTVSFDGRGITRHFVMTNGATLRLINLTLMNGIFVGANGQTNKPGNPGWGGAIYNSGGRLELIDCKFMSNLVVGGIGGPPADFGGIGDAMAGGPAYGGAVYSVDGQVSATNCLFANNSSIGGRGFENQPGDAGGGGESFGGAICSTNGGLTLTGVTFTNNVAKGGEVSDGVPNGSGGGAYGGALAEMSIFGSINNCVFTGNQASSATKVAFDSRNTGDAKGGGLFHGSGVMNIVATLFSANTAQGAAGNNQGGRTIISGAGNGGAVFNQSGNLGFRNSALISNQANGGPGVMAPWDSYGGTGAGGAIYNLGELAVINCTFAQNSANGGAGEHGIDYAQGGSAYGGAIFSGGGGSSLLNVTVSGNSIQAGTRSPAPPPAPNALGSSIFITNGAINLTLTNTILSCSPSQTNVSGTIIDGGHNICSDASASFSTASSHNNLDPLLALLGDNGGPTPTMALLPASPAIDIGDDAACPPTDQRGVARPKGLACDVGAFELAPKLTLNKGLGSMMTLNYIFRASETNAIRASTNLLNWILLGTRISDANGTFQFEDPDSVRLSRRFYQVQVQKGQ